MATKYDWLVEIYKRMGFGVRLLAIALVILLLHVPVNLIHEQVLERQQSRQEAQKDIASKWGQRQTVIGPRLVIPYYQISAAGGAHVRHYATFLPKNLQAKVNVRNELRYRGIYAVPVYQSDIRLAGSFQRPDFSKLGLKNVVVLWNEAALLVEVNDARAIQKKIKMTWMNQEQKMKPGLSGYVSKGQGFYAPVENLLSGKTFGFDIRFEINGSKNLSVAPVGKHSFISMHSNWKDPSFQGHWLPYKRRITRKGFDAEWRVSDISRNYPQQWRNEKFDTARLHQVVVGADFIMTVDSYRMTIRSMKYFLLFVGFTFALIWVLETVMKLRVHIVQYGFLGMAMALFYLLLTALAEHAGFGFAYFLASLLVVLTVTMYSRTMLKSAKHALMVGLASTALYIYLYFLLQEAKYSFLIGSFSVFGALVLTMYLTRRLDWHKLSARTQEAARTIQSKPAGEPE